jgi:hypothetical protein
MGTTALYHHSALRKRLFHTPNILYSAPLIPIGLPTTLVPAIPCLAFVPHFFLLSFIFYTVDKDSRILQNNGNDILEHTVSHPISRTHFFMTNVNIRESYAKPLTWQWILKGERRQKANNIEGMDTGGRGGQGS